MSDILNIAVIGGGPAGLFAALNAALYANERRIRLNISIFESCSRVGKKILVTGNGKCNLSNAFLSAEYYLGNKKFINGVFEVFDNKDTVDFFHKLGLMTRQDSSGRIYPLCNQASTVLNILRYKCEELGVEIKNDILITDIKIKDRIVLNSEFVFDSIIIAVGSPAGGRITDHSFEALNKLGVKNRRFLPALCPLEIRNFTKSLKGVRAEGNIKLYSENQLIAQDSGELQYTQTGISGIPSMQISGKASELLARKVPASVCIDSAPGLASNDIASFIDEQKSLNPNKTISMVLSGILQNRLAEYLIKEAGVKPETAICKIGKEEIDCIIRQVKEKKYPVYKTGGWDSAQSSVGGVLTDELIPETMRLKKYNNIFVCGEAVDVCGACGGYNLQWAWSSGYIAGISAVKGQEN